MPAEKDISDLKVTVNYTAMILNDVRKQLDDTAVTLEKNTETSALYREHVVEQLATIRASILTFTDYKIKFEDDRQNKDERLKSLELWRSNQKGAISMLMIITASVWAFAGWAVSSYTSIKDIFKHS